MTKMLSPVALKALRGFKPVVEWADGLHVDVLFRILLYEYLITVLAEAILYGG